MIRRWTGRALPWFVALVLASLASFVVSTAAVLRYDTGYDKLLRDLLGAYVPLQIENALPFLYLALTALVVALATWRLGVRGALIALAGFVIVGPFLFFNLSPLSSAPPGRSDPYGMRELTSYAGIFFGTLAFLIVSPITLAVRWTWRRYRRAGSPDPPAADS